MYTLGTAILGILLGALGSEILRARCPELIKRVEDSAKRVAESLSPSQSAPGGNEEDTESPSCHRKDS